MHVLAIRKDIVEGEPWIANSVLKSFTRAKDICLQEMSDVTALSVSMPWIAAELLDTRALMGHDIWPYGFQENIEELTVMCVVGLRPKVLPIARCNLKNYFIQLRLTDRGFRKGSFKRLIRFGALENSRRHSP